MNQKKLKTINESQEFIYRILVSNNVVASIKENLDLLLSIIPELSSMIGFNHMHPHHHLDVWEHTLYALSLSKNNFDTRLALLLHDIGKPHSYSQDGEIRHYHGHAAKSAEMTSIILSRLQYDINYIHLICNIIELHDTPLTEEFINKNYELSKLIFSVQYCDCLAHNPEKNVKRLAYIEKINNILTDTKYFC